MGISDHSNPEINKSIVAAVSFYQGISLLEKHFTILEKDKTKDGPVSANPNQLKEIVMLSKSNKENIKSYIDQNILDYKILLGTENRDMTEVELLNRDYYQGRFASKIKKNKYIFNWEEYNF